MIELKLETSAAIQAIDITDRVTALAWPDGFAWIGCPHTTAALVIGEGDPDMLEDYERVARDTYAPYEPFKHHRNDNPNAPAHLVSSFAGTQLLFPVVGSRLVLGTFQRIVLIELDGPKPGRVIKLASLPAGPDPVVTEG